MCMVQAHEGCRLGRLGVLRSIHSFCKVSRRRLLVHTAGFCPKLIPDTIAQVGHALGEGFNLRSLCVSPHPSHGHKLKRTWMEPRRLATPARTPKRDVFSTTTHQLNRCASPPSGAGGSGAKAVLQTASLAVLTIETDPAGHFRLGARPSPAGIHVFSMRSAEFPARVVSVCEDRSRRRSTPFPSSHTRIDEASGESDSVEGRRSRDTPGTPSFSPGTPCSPAITTFGLPPSTAAGTRRMQCV